MRVSLLLLSLVGCTSTKPVSVDELKGGGVAGVSLHNVTDLGVLAEKLQTALDGRDCTPEVTVDGTTVVVLDQRCKDDSVEATKLWLHFERDAQGVFNIVRAERAWRCWPDRGHTTFSTAPCS